MDYLLFVFAYHENQEKMVNILATEISTVVDSSEIKYYYGPQSVIFTFKSNDEMDVLKEFFQMTLADAGIVYFLLPFEPDKMSFWMDDNIVEHLFGCDKKSEERDISKEQQIEVQKLLFKDLEEINSMLDSIDDDDDDDDFMLKPKKKELTLDELLDKINEKGIDSLSSEEKKLLTKYSK